jgi:1,4-alpha-glucan branching enzyme
MTTIANTRRDVVPASTRADAEFGAVTQQGITNQTPMGAHLVPGGATFRVWAPEALEVHIRLARTGDVINEPGDAFEPCDATRLQHFSDGRWAGFVSGVQEGDHYRFYIVGRRRPYKRDPYARELEFYDWPNVDCIVRNPNSYPWHDGNFRTPPFHDAIIYQLHVGTWYSVDKDGYDNRTFRVAKFLDAVDRIPYLAELGVTMIQPLPIIEFQSPRSLGYDGTDLFSPEMDYGVEPRHLGSYLEKVNRLLADRGQPPLEWQDLEPQINQLKAFIDLCHLYGMGVLVDVVYNHAGGFGEDDGSLYFFDRNNTGNNNESLYFTDQGWAGGLVFAYWKQEVRQFLIDNAKFFLDEYHVDGFRYDEVSVIDRFGGWSFCQDLTGTVSFLRPDCLQIAEFWADDQSWAVRPPSENGAGFNSVVHAGLRETVRAVIAQAAQGREARVDLDPVREALRCPPGFTASWQTVQHLENHDRQRINNTTDREPRIPALGDPSDARSWYARSRARVANGLLLTAPGIPMLFMGQEFLEDKHWTDDPDHHPHNLIWWDGLVEDRAMQDHLRFMRELIHLRRRHPALRGESLNPYYVHNDNRILAFHRWIEGVGRDVVVVASLDESTYYEYDLGFPQTGQWFEAFNSDVYDHWVNPQRVGNGGSIWADGGPRDGLPASARIAIPANSLLVFTRDHGDPQ